MMPWYLWLLIAWCILSPIVGVLVGRALSSAAAQCPEAPSVPPPSPCYQACSEVCFNDWYVEPSCYQPCISRCDADDAGIQRSPSSSPAYNFSPSPYAWVLSGAAVAVDPLPSSDPVPSP